MATHSSVLAWRISGTGEPGGLPSMGSHRVGHDLAAAAAAGEGELIQNPAVTAGGTPRLCASSFLILFKYHLCNETLPRYSV